MYLVLTNAIYPAPCRHGSRGLFPTVDGRRRNRSIGVDETRVLLLQPSRGSIIEFALSPLVVLLLSMSQRG